MSLKIWIGISLLGLFLGSLALRESMTPEKSKASPTVSKKSDAATPGFGQSLVPIGQESPNSSTPEIENQSTDEGSATGDSFIAKSLPFFTEASFFALIGFSLGYFSRKVVKLMMIFVAVLFIALQVLGYMEVVAIDWQRLIDICNRLILNLKENDSISAVLKDRIPTAGALVGGYALGFKKG